MTSFADLLQIIALIVFIVAAVGLSYQKAHLIPAGLGLWVLAWLVDGRLNHLNVATILLLLAFIVFVLAAIGWGYKKIGLIAVGLGLWMASIVLSKFIGGLSGGIFGRLLRRRQSSTGDGFRLRGRHLAARRVGERRRPHDGHCREARPARRGL